MRWRSIACCRVGIKHPKGTQGGVKCSHKGHLRGTVRASSTTRRLEVRFDVNLDRSDFDRRIRTQLDTEDVIELVD